VDMVALRRIQCLLFDRKYKQARAYLAELLVALPDADALPPFQVLKRKETMQEELDVISGMAQGLMDSERIQTNG